MGVTVQLASAGKPEQEKLTVPEKAALDVRVSVVVPAAPAESDILVDDVLIVNEGATAVTVTVTLPVAGLLFASPG